MIEPRVEIFYDHRDEEERIRVLQEMLRTVARYSGDMSLSTAVDGSFDTGTQNAVRAFQRKYGLAETGTVDFATWDSLRDIYGEYLRQNTVPNGIYPFFSPQLRLRSGDRGDLVLIVQIMLNALRLLYSGWDALPMTGEYDRATAEAVRIFQKADLLDVTGETDCETWNELALQYNIVARDRQ